MGYQCGPRLPFYSITSRKLDFYNNNVLHFYSALYKNLEGHMIKSACEWISEKEVHEIKQSKMSCWKRLAFDAARKEVKVVLTLISGFVCCSCPNTHFSNRKKFFQVDRSSGVVNAVVGEYQNLVVDALSNMQSVKFLHRRGDVVFISEDETHSSILNPL